MVEVIASIVGWFHDAMASILPAASFWLFVSMGALLSLLGAFFCLATISDRGEGLHFGLAMLGCGLVCLYFAGASSYRHQVVAKRLEITPARFDSLWPTLKPGDTLRGPNGIVYQKAPWSTAYSEIREYNGATYGRNSPTETWKLIRPDPQEAPFVAPADEVIQENQSQSEWVIESERPISPAPR